MADDLGMAHCESHWSEPAVAVCRDCHRHACVHCRVEVHRLGELCTDCAIIRAGVRWRARAASRERASPESACDDPRRLGSSASGGSAVADAEFVAFGVMHQEPGAAVLAPGLGCHLTGTEGGESLTSGGDVGTTMSRGMRFLADFARGRVGGRASVRRRRWRGGRRSPGGGLHVAERFGPEIGEAIGVDPTLTPEGRCPRREPAGLPVWLRDRAGRGGTGRLTSNVTTHGAGELPFQLPVAVSPGGSSSSAGAVDRPALGADQASPTDGAAESTAPGTLQMSVRPPRGCDTDRPEPVAFRQPRLVVEVMKRLEFPTKSGPWSVRRFSDRSAADAFYQRLERLEAGHHPPVLLSEPLLTPDDSVLPASSWIVLYQPILGLHAGAA